MKTLFMLPLLLAPVASYGQANLFEEASIGDAAPIKTYRVDAGIGKGFQLAFSTLFFPDRVKNEWPVYGYSIKKLSALCSEQPSVYGEVFTVKKAALIRLRRDLSEDADAYLGIPIRPTEGGSITRRMEEICTGIEKSDLARKLRIYDVIDLPSGTWKKIENPLLEDVIRKEAIPLLSGTLTAGDVSERNYNMAWTLSESPEPGTSSMKVVWNKYNPKSDEHRQSPGAVWKYVPDGDTPNDVTYYLAKTIDSSRNDERSRRNEGEIATWSSWAGEFHTESISDFTPDSRYLIRYLLNESQQSEESQQYVDDWFLVTDEPLPRAKADIRIDPFE